MDSKVREMYISLNDPLKAVVLPDEESDATDPHVFCWVGQQSHRVDVNRSQD